MGRQVVPRGGAAVIADKCKPLNQGESPTVRIVMGVNEAYDICRDLRRLLDGRTMYVKLELLDEFLGYFDRKDI